MAVRAYLIRTSRSNPLGLERHRAKIAQRKRTMAIHHPSGAHKCRAPTEIWRRRWSTTTGSTAEDALEVARIKRRAFVTFTAVDSNLTIRSELIVAGSEEIIHRQLDIRRTAVGVYCQTHSAPTRQSCSNFSASQPGSDPCDEQ